MLVLDRLLEIHGDFKMLVTSWFKMIAPKLESTNAAMNRGQDPPYGVMKRRPRVLKLGANLLSKLLHTVATLK